MSDQRPQKYQQWHGRTVKRDARTLIVGLEKDNVQGGRPRRCRDTTPMGRFRTFGDKGDKSIKKCKNFNRAVNHALRKAMTV